MANSIEIEIVANFKDNATDQAKELSEIIDKLNKENLNLSVSVTDNATGTTMEIGDAVDRLDKRNAVIDVSVNDNATAILDAIEERLAKLDGSDVMKTFEKVNEFSEQILSGTTKLTLGVDDQVTPAISTAQRKLQEFENAQKKWTLRETSPGNYQPFYGYSLANETRTLHGSVPRTVDNIKNGELAGPAERIADELSDINHSAKSYVPKGGYTYNDDAVRAIEIAPAVQEADRKLLEQDARTMGIKFSAKTSNDELSQKIADYEDKNYWSKQGSQSNREIIAAGEEQGEEITDGYLTSLGQGMKQVTSKVASRFMGARMLYKGISDAASDFTSAFEAENGLDRQRSLARSATKAGVMGTGALVGSLVGMPMLGAGAGALVSDLFGDDLADALSGIHKSAAELAQDHIDELFGDIAMSADEMMVVVKGLTGTTKSLQMGYNQQSVQTEYALAQSSTDAYYGLKQQGSELEIRNNLGLKTEKDEREAYKQSVEDYTDGLKKTLLQQMYDGFAANDDLYGYGNWDATALSEKYQDTYGELEKTTKDLFNYLDRAFSDNDFSTDEIEHVASVLAGLKELSSKSAPDEFAVNNEKYNWMISNGMLSKEAYDTFQGDIWSNLDNQIENIANTRARAVLENPDARDEAEKNAGNQIVSAYEASAQTWLRGFDQTFGEDYETQLERAYKGKDTVWNGRHALGVLKDSRESNEWQGLYAGYESEMEGNEGMLAAGLANFSRKLSGGWDSVDNSKREVFNGEYAKLSPEIEKMENYLAAASQIEGVDTSAPMDELMKMYSIGAMGGGAEGKIAANKFNAMYMAGDEEMAGFINQAFGSDYERMDKFMGKGFSEAWQLIFGQNQEGSEKVVNQLNEAGEKIQEAEENAVQKASDAAGDVASTATDTVEESVENASETIRDKTEGMFDSITDTVEKGNEKADEAVNNTSESINELGQNILEAVSESLDNIDADMLGESNIGEKLMNSIEESLSADNMDFGELSIGQSILAGISSSFEGVEFGELDIGTKIMDGINSSIEAADISGVIDPIKSDLEVLNAIECKPNIEAQDNASSIISSVSKAISDLDGKSATVSISIQTNSSIPHFADGTDSALGGAAFVNDDTVSDPRELIYQNGHFMMYEGRDVLTSLAPGAKVFTAAQTKDILSGKGIPHFAEGVNNDVIATNREVIGSGSSGASVSLEQGAVQITIEVNGANGNVIEEIRSRISEVTEPIVAEIQRHLSASFANSSGGDD